MGSGKKFLQALTAGVEKIADAANQQIQPAQYGTSATPSFSTSQTRQPPQSFGGAYISDHEKKAFIISSDRRLWGNLCDTFGTQPPLVRLDDSGRAIYYWLNNDELIRTTFQAFGRPIPTSLPTNQQLAEVERLVVDSWQNQANITCTITNQGDLAVVTETFSSYREMIDVMYRAAKIITENSVSQAQAVQAAHARFDHEKAQIDTIMRQADEQNLRLSQMVGAAPLYYKNGIPHYGGL